MYSSLYFEPFKVEESNLNNKKILDNCINFLDKIKKDLIISYSTKSIYNDVLELDLNILHDSSFWNYSINEKGNFILRTNINKGEYLDDYFVFDLDYNNNVVSFTKTCLDQEDCLSFYKYFYSDNILQINVYTRRNSFSDVMYDDILISSEFSKDTNSFYQFIKLSDLGTLNLEISLKKIDNTLTYSGGKCRVDYIPSVYNTTYSGVVVFFDNELGLSLVEKDYVFVLSHDGLFYLRNAIDEKQMDYCINDRVISKDNFFSLNLDSDKSIKSAVEMHKLVSDYDITDDVNYIKEILKQSEKFKELYSNFKTILEECIEVPNKDNFLKIKNTTLLIEEAKKILIENKNKIYIDISNKFI